MVKSGQMVTHPWPLEKIFSIILFFHYTRSTQMVLCCTSLEKVYPHKGYDIKSIALIGACMLACKYSGYKYSQKTLLVLKITLFICSMLFSVAWRSSTCWEGAQRLAFHVFYSLFPKERCPHPFLFSELFQPCSKKTCLNSLTDWDETLCWTMWFGEFWVSSFTLCRQVYCFWIINQSQPLLNKHDFYSVRRTKDV